MKYMHHEKLLLLTILLAAVLLTSCIKKPNPPSWDMNLNFPLIDTVYYVRDFLNEGPFSINPGDSAVVLDLSFELDTIKIDENFVIEDWDTTVTESIGTITLSNRRTRGTGLGLPDMGIPAWMAESLAVNDSIYTYVPPTDTQTAELLDSIEDVKWAYIKRGVMNLRLKNSFPFELDPFLIDLYNINGDTVKLREIETAIPPGSTVVIPADTSDIFITNKFMFTMQFATPGTQTQVWLKESDSVNISLEVDTLEVESLLAYLEKLDFSDSTELRPDIDLGEIDTVVFYSGSMTFQVENFSDIAGQFRLSIPEIEIDTQFTVNGAQTSPWVGSYSIPLSGRTLHPGDSNTVLLNYRVELTPGWYSLAAGDRITTTAGLRNLEFSHFTGTIDSLEMEIPEIDTSINIPDGFGNISFHRVFLSPFVSNSMGFEARASFYVTVKKGDETRSDTFLLTIPASDGGEPALWDTLLDISELLEIYPENIRAGGSVLINGEGRANRDDFVWTRVELCAPLSVIINPDTITTDVAIDSSVIDSSIGETVKSGELFLSLRNRLPLGIRVKLHVCEKEKGDSLLKVVDIPSAPLSEAGWSERDTAFYVKLSLSEEEMKLFSRKPRESWAEIILPGTSGEPVTLRASDYISLKGFARLRVRIEE